MMKKKFLTAILIVIALFCVYLLWPRSLERYTADCEMIRIYYVEDGIREESVSGEATETENVESNASNVGSDVETYLESENVEYTRGQTEFDAVLEILDSYTVHKTLSGLVQSVTGQTPSLEGNADGYYLNIYLYDMDGNCTWILCGGTGEMIVDGEHCRMGYFGSGKNEAFMGELLDVLSDNLY